MAYHKKSFRLVIVIYQNLIIISFPFVIVIVNKWNNQKGQTTRQTTDNVWNIQEARVYT